MKGFRRFFGFYLILDLLLMAAVFAKGGWLWLLNAQVAFIASLLVTFSSFFAYRRMVAHEATDKKVSIYEERDLLDRIEDPYELYEEAEISAESLKEVITEEKAKLRSFRRTGEHLKKSAKGFLSPWRLGAYLILVLAFLFLNRQGVFVIWPFLAGLAVVPVGSFLAAVSGNHRSAEYHT